MHGHGHSHGLASAELRTAEGIRTAKWSSLGLLIAGAIELGMFALGHSAGLLADAIHNLGDVSTTLAIWAAFSLSRRQTSARYPYGLHRVEDLAGLFVLLVMTASGVAAGYSSVQHLITGAHPTHLFYSAAAALAGLAGNELVAEFKIRSGRRIGSVSLIADGNHSRTDGLVSLAAFAGIIGVALGFQRADGIAGVVITVVIAGVIISSARGIIGRTLDAVDPALTRQIEHEALEVPRVAAVHDVRGRWAGRALFVTLSIVLPPDLTLADAHAVAEDVRHQLLHEIENLRAIDIHMDPLDAGQAAPAHARTEHHREADGSYGSGDADRHDDHGHDDHDEHSNNGHDHDDPGYERAEHEHSH